MIGAVAGVAKTMWPEVVILPILSAGASDSAFTRTAGIPSYGVDGMFDDLDDGRAHGRDERIGVTAFPEDVEFTYRLMKVLAGGVFLLSITGSTLKRIDDLDVDEVSLKLSVTTTQPFASATAAMMVSSALLGSAPLALPSAASLAQTRPAFSSKGRIRPANRVGGPSGPANQSSSWARRLPEGFSRTPRRISAMVSEAMKRSSSACSAIQAIRESDGVTLVMLLRMLVSSR